MRLAMTLSNSTKCPLIGCELLIAAAVAAVRKHRSEQTSFVVAAAAAVFISQEGGKGAVRATATGPS